MQVEYRMFIANMLYIMADERQFTTNISLCWHSSVAFVSNNY